MTMTAQPPQKPTGITVPGRTGPVNIAEVFAARKGALEALLPKHLSADRLIKVALFSMSRTPALQKCSAESLLTALMRAAEAGLEVDGHEAALVPYKGECTFIPMYEGLLKLAHQHPKVLSVDADVVRDGDRFRHRKGLEPLLEHVKADSGRGEVTHAWAVAFLKGGGRTCVVLTRDEIDAVKARSPSASSSSSPWLSDFGAMAQKTAIRRLSKLLPKTSRMKAAMDGEEVEGEVMSRHEGGLVAQLDLAGSGGVHRVKAALAAKRPTITDVGPDESEEEALRRTMGQAAPMEPGAGG